MGGRHKDPEYHKKWWEKNKHKYKEPRPHSDSDYQKNYYRENKEKVLTRQRKVREDDPQKRLFKSAKQSSKIRGLAFEISLEDVVIPTVCPVFKLPFNRFTDMSPSIDRVDNSRGYVKGNVQVISRKANSMKYTASGEELLQFADWVNKNYTPLNLEEVLSEKS